MGILDDYLAQEGIEMDEPKAAPKLPSQDYATTTATNQAGRVQEAKAQGREEFSNQRFSDSLIGGAYGVARGATLGAVDRAVGLGAAIGEKLGASDEIPANPNAYQEARSDYLSSEATARENAPWSYAAGSIAGGIVPTIASAPLSIASRLQQAKPLAQFGGRLADAAIQGGVSGAFNTASDDPTDIAKGAAIGAGIGAGTQATAGELVRKAIANAPKKELSRTIQEVMESDAGRATQTTGQKLARDIKDIEDVLEKDVELRRAMRLPAEEARKVLKPRIEAAGVGKPENYATVDKVLGKKNQLTDVKLLQELVDVEGEISKKNLPLVTQALQKVRDSVRQYYGPAWAREAGKEYTNKALPISTSQLREFVSSVQGTAEAAMGSINGTNAAKVPAEVAQLVNKVLEKRLDKAAEMGAAKEVAAIRESDRLTSAYLGINKALDQRGIRETMKAKGLSQRLAKAGEQTENAAAMGLLAAGQPGAAAAVKARKPVFEALDKVSREMNDRVLAPLQRAATEGKSWAEMTKIAAEVGAPLSVARYVYDRVSPKEYEPTPNEVPQDERVLTTPIKKAPRSDYAVDTRTR